MHPGSPPVPPLPTQQGNRGGPTPAFRMEGGLSRQDFRPQGPAPPPPGGLQQPPRPQSSSTRIVDLTPRRPLDEDSCRKRLTHYEAFTIRKIAPHDSNMKATWAKSKVTKEPLSQDDILREVRKMSESRRSVQEKKAALMPNQESQVNALMDDLKNGDNDLNFEWSLAQLDQRIFTNKKGQKETSTITIYVKRAPLNDLNVIDLFSTIERNKQAIERNKQARLDQMSRPPPPPPRQEPIEEPGPGSRPNPNISGMGPKPKVMQGPAGVRLRRPKKKDYRGHSSASSQSSSSESEGDSAYTSDERTTISTDSDRHSRKYNRTGRSQSRRREHRKKYHADERIRSPELNLPSPVPMPLPLGAIPRYVPDVPSQLFPIAFPAFDPLTAAYEAGKNANAERFNHDGHLPRRPTERAPAMVSYDRPERVERLERVYSEPAPHIVEQVRYVDRPEPVRQIRYVDRPEEREVRYIGEREDEYFRRDEQRRRRDAEEYMDRHSNDPRPGPRITYAHPNPFAPMRSPRQYEYTPSVSSRDSRNYREYRL